MNMCLNSKAYSATNWNCPNWSWDFFYTHARCESWYIPANHGCIIKSHKWDKLPTSTGECRISEPSTVGKGLLLTQIIEDSVKSDSLVSGQRSNICWPIRPFSFKFRNPYLCPILQNNHFLIIPLAWWVCFSPVNFKKMLVKNAEWKIFLKHPPLCQRLPSRELTYPTWGSSENHLQNAIFDGIC